MCRPVEPCLLRHPVIYTYRLVDPCLFETACDTYRYRPVEPMFIGTSFDINIHVHTCGSMFIGTPCDIYIQTCGSMFIGTPCDTYRYRTVEPMFIGTSFDINIHVHTCGSMFIGTPYDIYIQTCGSMFI